MNTTELLQGIVTRGFVRHDLEIAGLATDSRQVRPGDLFVAIPGTGGDGMAYAAQAVAAGAVAVLGKAGGQGPEGVPFFEVGNPRHAAAMLAARFFAPQPAHLVAVTGTDGKSSTVEFLRQLWASAGIPGAALGTIGLKATVPLKREYEAVNTTPDPVVLHRLLGELKREGIDHVALEASSHGLDQHRLDGMRPGVAVFTTFGQDHLDYHVSHEAYFSAKSRLFTERLAEGGAMVLNADSERIMRLSVMAPRRGFRVTSFGEAGNAARLIDHKADARGQSVVVEIGGEQWRGVVPLYGRFQVMNVLAASAAAFAGGLAPKTIFAALPKLAGVRGRLELAARKGEAPIFVDYAHTAQGLEQALSALRPHVRGKLKIVFGCGGDRDAGKRPQMGGMAARFADEVIVTDDNPRHEDPAAIRRAVLAGVTQAGATAREIGDRRAAIAEAARGLRGGDILLVAGKGHETLQLVGDEKLPFDDAAVAREVAG